MRKKIILYFLCILKLSFNCKSDSFDHNYKSYSKILKNYVTEKEGETKILYSKLKEKPEVLIKTIKAFEKVTLNEYNKWSRDKQFSFLLNAYNLYVLGMVLKFFPITSVNDVEGFFNNKNKEQNFRLFQKDISLDQIEEKYLKPFKNPLYHFAIVCSSKGCPALSQTPYVHKKIVEDLNVAETKFLNNKNKNYYDQGNNTLYLSEVFKWYRDEFIEYKKNYLMKLPLKMGLNLSKKPIVKFINFDWSINSDIQDEFIESNSLGKSEPSTFDHNYRGIKKFLYQNVRLRNGRYFADYEGMLKNRKIIKKFLKSVKKVTKKKYDSWEKNQKKAFLINLYNIATIKWILKFYKKDKNLKSIKDTVLIVQSPWRQNFIKLFGKKVSLDFVEHGLLRANFKDARIHFAVNCASFSCPDLKNSPYLPDSLDRELNNSSERFINNNDLNYFDEKNKILYLSKLFSWYKDDFINESKNLCDYFLKFYKNSNKKIINQIRKCSNIYFLNYNWNLNKL